ncbi:MAG: glycoside hydrolase family 5 protein [Acidobacteriia bacterium]|nr:glycoside hydrolase family 5 protein [Terriglobia bacterium]
MGRGVNILGYDPIWDDFRRARFQQRHFRLIHEGGFHTVRINLHAFRHMNDANRLNAAWFRTLDWAVQNALANNLQVILDEHDFRACGTDPDGCKPKLLAFWEQVAERYKDAPNGVVFELLNEPNTQLTPEAWNALMKDALAIVRKTNPRRNVVIGPASENDIHFLDQLQLPADDRNIIVTVHYYLPMEFTHQGANWCPATTSLSGVKWGTDQEERRIEEDFDAVQQWSKNEKRPVLLGEFGAYDKGDMDSRFRYISCIARAAERFGWAWTYWQFDSDFVLWDMARDAWVQPIWKALVP